MTTLTLTPTMLLTDLILAAHDKDCTGPACWSEREHRLQLALMVDSWRAVAHIPSIELDLSAW